MPSLPRSPFGRRSARAVAPDHAQAPDEPRVEVVESPGLRWVDIERPRSVDQAWLEERFEFHPLDEEEIFEGEPEEVVRDISNVKQEIINFRKVVRPQRAAFRDLDRTKDRSIAEDLDIYFDDIQDASERIWDMLENYKEVVEALEATNESVLSHQVNDVLRVLTAFS